MTPISVDQIRLNLTRIEEQIATTALNSGRQPEDIRLVVVTKGQPVEMIEAAILAGAKILGENYPEETVPKKAFLDEYANVEWHMIGHLQSRKTRLVCENFQCMHSLDSVKLAEKLDRTLKELHKSMPVLLEINVGGEMSKYGWQVGSEDDFHTLLPEIEKILSLSNLKVRGLMTMPPISVSEQETAGYFRRLAKLRTFLEQQFPGLKLDELSMGTSYDFLVAIREGATLVRIGQAILGPRPIMR